MSMLLRAFLTFLALLIAQIARAQTPRLDAIPIDLMVRFVPPPVRAEDGRHLTSSHDDLISDGPSALRFHLSTMDSTPSSDQAAPR